MKLIFIIIYFSFGFSNYLIEETKSKIEYFGIHPLHSWSGSSSQILLISDCNEIETNKCDLEFHLPIMTLNSGNDNRDSNMLNYLNAYVYPKVIISFDDFLIKEYNGELLPAKININGIKKMIKIPLKVSKSKGNDYFTSSIFTILLSDFGIKLPQLFFLPINDELKIDVNLLIKGS